MSQDYSYRDVWFGILLLMAAAICWLYGEPHGEASVPKDACPIKWLLDPSRA